MSTERSHRNLGRVVTATDVATSFPSPTRARNVLLLLAGSVALMMTGFGIILPIFARRLGEFGAGVESLGLMTMSFALAAFLAAPFVGSLADRIGRRPIVLVALAAFVVANIGFLFAPSEGVFIAVRAFEGGFTAGLLPAAMGIVADIIPENKRAQWVGIVMGGMGAGFIFGPVIGGVLYDAWGFEAPFIASAAMGFLALMAATVLVPETRTNEVRWREKLRQRRSSDGQPAQKTSVWTSLPRPLYLFGVLLVLDFVLVFAFAFIEPQMVFFFYEELDWSTVQFGVVVAAYGLAMVIGQTVFGRSSDKFGRKPVIIVGILVTAVFYFGLAVITWFPLMLVVALIAGLGLALVTPALSAFYLDITSERHRSRIVGIKESSVALGGVAGPLLVVGASGWTTPQGVFITSGVIILAAAVLALVALRGPRRAAGAAVDVEWECSTNRCMAAHATLRGVVIRASTARGARVAA